MGPAISSITDTKHLSLPSFSPFIWGQLLSLIHCLTHALTQLLLPACSLLLTLSLSLHVRHSRPALCSPSGHAQCAWSGNIPKPIIYRERLLKSKCSATYMYTLSHATKYCYLIHLISTCFKWVSTCITTTLQALHNFRLH